MTAWVALAVAVLDLALWVGVFVFVLLAWRRLAPSVAPLLQMFAPPPSAVGGGAEPAAPYDQAGDARTLL